MMRGGILRAAALGISLLLLGAGIAHAAIETQVLRTPTEAIVWSKSVLGVRDGVAGATPSVRNANRFMTHHYAGSALAKVYQLDVCHVSVDGAADTMVVRFWNSGVADSITVIGSATAYVWYSVPLYGDSLSFKPLLASKAGDWFIRSVFKR